MIAYSYFHFQKTKKLFFILLMLIELSKKEI